MMIKVKTLVFCENIMSTETSRNDYEHCQQKTCHQGFLNTSSEFVSECRCHYSCYLSAQYTEVLVPKFTFDLD